MDAAAFCHLYDYHFAANRKIWNDYIVPLRQEDFVRDVNYSVGSLRNHAVHLMNVDDRWFSKLRGEVMPDFLEPAPFTDREQIRQQWNAVEQRMREYLTALHDENLFQKPFATPDKDDPLYLWQILLHVANHGTDHRAQMLRLLHDLGVETAPQDYFYYIEGRL